MSPASRGRQQTGKLNAMVLRAELSSHEWRLPGAPTLAGSQGYLMWFPGRR